MAFQLAGDLVELRVAAARQADDRVLGVFRRNVAAAGKVEGQDAADRADVVIAGFALLDVDGHPGRHLDGDLQARPAIDAETEQIDGDMRTAAGAFPAVRADRGRRTAGDLELVDLALPPGGGADLDPVRQLR